MPTRSQPISRRAFSLLEALVVITIMGIIAASTLPIMQGVTTNAANSDRLRRVSESNAYAVDRIVRLLRDTPPATMSGALAITTATATSITFTDGRALALSGTDLLYQSAPGTQDILASNVTAFEITYLAADGTTSTLATPQTTQRFVVRLVIDDFELRIAAFPRVRLQK
ncbi:hypothetical protein LBMAG48_19210 [Phycisphaerae bacterium]|jgi:prepilin-type N-terminal cleavage/methylation domain-containing protein|nr:hypothetical protein LBMAG48_19210 [Phycisphaerae bacterium]